MKCPDCSARLSCTDSRTKEDIVSRRYVCKACDKPHYTVEVFRDKVLSGPKVGSDKFKMKSQLRKAALDDLKRRIIAEIEKMEDL